MEGSRADMVAACSLRRRARRGDDVCASSSCLRAGGRRRARVKQACCRCEGCWEPLGVVSRTDVPQRCERYQKLHVTAEKSSSSSRLRLLLPLVAGMPSVLQPLARFRHAVERPGDARSSVVPGKCPRGLWGSQTQVKPSGEGARAPHSRCTMPYV